MIKSKRGTLIPSHQFGLKIETSKLDGEVTAVLLLDIYKVFDSEEGPFLNCIH